LTKEARSYNREKIVSSINGAGKTGQLHGKRIKLDHFFKKFLFIFKVISVPNVGPEIKSQILH